MTGIEALGVRTHNLRGIDVTLPHHAIVAVTGVSGSGKSSLVLDTLHAEARLRYVEGFDPYVRKFLTPRDRPQVDRIRGLTATLAVDQRNANNNPNSTLGTLTGLEAYLGLVFARLGPLTDGAEWTGPLHPAQFDPYSREGICPGCVGAREIVRADPELIVGRPELPLLEGGSAWFGHGQSNEELALGSLAGHHGTGLERPWREQPEEFRQAVLYGTGGEKFDVVYTGSNLTYRTRRALEGAVAEIERAYAAADPEAKRIYLPFLDRRECRTCGGTGLGEIARTVTLGGKTFRDVTGDRVSGVREWIRAVDAGLGAAQRTVGQVLVPELSDRLDLLIRLGLGHLELCRGAPTLSGGELQRARLSAQISTALTGLTYVFDEPGAGLHPVDKDPLFRILRELRDAGNTVLLVEHDPDLIARADWVVDLGPGGGRDGGRLVASGPPAEIAQVKLDMQFLGDTYLTCPRCDGRRYGPDVLAIRYRGLAIDEVLTTTVTAAVAVFDGPRPLAALLRAMVDVGLGYLTLGESGTALSGGEAQRLKLAKAIVGGRGPGLVVLDEPVTGLHPADAQRLIGALDLLLERGHTVVMAEHDPHAAAAADWIIDLGPGAGPDGGRILNEGPPALVAHGTGPTAPYLLRLTK